MPVTARRIFWGQSRAKSFSRAAGRNRTIWPSSARRGCSRRKGNHLITSAVEHHAVLQCFDYLEKKEGFAVTRLPVDRDGRVSPEDLKRALRADTILVSIMAANNEIGTIQPVAELGCNLPRAGNHFSHGRGPMVWQGTVSHYPAIQRGFGFHLRPQISRTERGGAAFHQIAACIRTRLLFGGGHENERRAGTENLRGHHRPGRGAGKICASRRFSRRRRLRTARRTQLIAGIQRIEGCELVSPAGHCLANTVSFVVRGADSIALLAGLDMEGICASSGSACSAGSLEPSHVILAIGKTKSANSLVRFSLGRDSTAEEVDLVCRILPEIIRRAQLRLIACERIVNELCTVRTTLTFHFSGFIP